MAHDHIIRLYILEVSVGCAATVSQTRRSGYMRRGSMEWRNSNRLTAAQPPVYRPREDVMMPRVLCAGIAAQAQEKTMVVLVKAPRSANAWGRSNESQGASRAHLHPPVYRFEIIAQIGSRPSAWTTSAVVDTFGMTLQATRGRAYRVSLAPNQRPPPRQYADPNPSLMGTRANRAK